MLTSWSQRPLQRHVRAREGSLLPTHHDSRLAELAELAGLENSVCIEYHGKSSTQRNCYYAEGTGNELVKNCLSQALTPFDPVLMANTGLPIMYSGVLKSRMHEAEEAGMQAAEEVRARMERKEEADGLLEEMQADLVKAIEAHASTVGKQAV